MKRILFILLATLSTAVCSAGTNAMSNSKVRKETRFLTDKMAYELNLSTEQYNDVYEINYDFISGVRYVMDDVLCYMVMNGHSTDIMTIWMYVMTISAGCLVADSMPALCRRSIFTAPSIPVETVGTSVFISRIPTTIISISPVRITTARM